MSSWNEAEKRAAEGSGPSNFIKLSNDGDKIVGAFVGEPEIREVIWDKKIEQYREPTKEEIEAKATSARFMINVYVPAEKIIKIWEINNATLKDVIEVKNKYGLDKWYFECKRHGVAKSTKTTYSILPETQLPAADLATIRALTLHDLKKTASDGDGSATDLNSHDKTKTNGTTNGTAAAAPPAAETVDEATARAIIERLKPRPKDQIDAFLQKFGIKTIKLLKKPDVPAALAMLDTFEGKTASAPAEVDPFA